MTTTLRVRLTQIAYGGQSVGRELEFTILAKKTRTAFSQEIAVGQTKDQDRLIFETELTASRSAPFRLPVTVRVREVDPKTDDRGERRKDLRIDRTCGAGPQDFTVEVEVIERGRGQRAAKAVLTFTFEATISVSYERNFEEEIGSRRGAVPGSPSTKSVEDHFIDRDRQAGLPDAPDRTATVVDRFVEALDRITAASSADASALDTAIATFGPALLTRARAAARANGFADADDRPLYWARIKMIVALKSNPAYACARKPRQRAVLGAFEAATRGYSSVDWSGASGRARVLITGFDPFDIDPARGGNIRQSNPSGAAALALHGADLPADAACPRGAYVQSMVFPVRYRDFDQNRGRGIVEQALTPFAVSRARADLIITLSQTELRQFEVDRFASRFRRGRRDNENVSGVSFPARVKGDEFYWTTLPVDAIVPAKGENTGTFPIFLANQFIYTFTDKGQPSEAKFTGGYADGPLGVEDECHPLHSLLVGTVPSELTDRSRPEKSEIKAMWGSGGDYLSNEIHYRLSRVRTLRNPTLATGHYHVPRLQPSGTDFDPGDTKALIDTVAATILKAVN